MSTTKQKTIEERKIKVFNLTMEGFNDQEIADKLNIGKSTVALYKKQMKEDGIDLPDLKKIRVITKQVTPEGVDSFEPVMKLPKRPGENETTFVIDGIAVNVPQGSTISIIEGKVQIKTH